MKCRVRERAEGIPLGKRETNDGHMEMGTIRGKKNRFPLAYVTSGQCLSLG